MPKAPLSDDGLPLDVALPETYQKLTPDQMAILLKRFQWPKEITGDASRLRDNLNYRLQRHAMFREDWLRQGRQIAGLQYELEHSPERLIYWPCVALQRLTGKMVLFNDATGDVTAVIDADYEKAAAEDKRRASLERYKAPPVKAKVVILDDANNNNLRWG